MSHFMPAVTQMLVQLDRTLFHAINGRLTCDFMDWVMPHVTDLGLGHVQALALLLGALVSGVLLHHGQPATLSERVRQSFRAAAPWLIPALAALVFTGIVVQGFKRLHRMRPSWYYHHEHVAGRARDVVVHTIPGRRPLRVNGFPSGHTATTAALTVVLGTTLGTRKSRRAAAWLMSILTFLVGWSRIYMSDHWPLDVLGGICIGALCGLLIVLLFRRRAAAREPLPRTVEAGT